MKKLIGIVLIILCCFACVASTTYIVNTDKGEQKVIIPDGMTEKDVMLKLAESYYNLSYLYDDLETEVKELTIQVSDYVEANKTLRSKYDELISDYQLLVSKYNTLNKLNWIQGSIGGFALLGDKGIKGGGVMINSTLFQTVDIFALVQYPVALGVGVSYRF